MSQQPSIAELIDTLQAQRGRPVLFWHAPLTDDAVPPLYECLNRLRPVEGLDLVLCTSGGSISTTRQIGLLLHEFTEQLTILVPYRARSAGTLLCLAGHQLVLGPLAELGPIDAVMGSDGPPAPDTPGAISAEDIRAFVSMAGDWFGIEGEQDRVQVLAMLASRIFPTSLSSFYRFDKLVRQAAADLLAFQLPGPARQPERDRIVEQLVSGYHSHDAVLTRRDVRALGLRVSDATPAEEAVLWSLWQAARRLIAPPTGPAAGPDRPAVDRVLGLIATTELTATNLVRRAGDQVSVDWQLTDDRTQ